MDVTAHASVLLALLFLLMVHVVDVDFRDPVHGTTLDLVRSRNATVMPGALREDRILVSIPRDGTVFLGPYRIQPADLGDAIREALQNGGERKVYLMVDAHARYGDVMYVLAEIRRAGIVNVCFIAW